MKATTRQGQPNKIFHTAYNKLAEVFGMFEADIYMWLIYALSETQAGIETALKLKPIVNKKMVGHAKEVAEYLSDEDKTPHEILRRYPVQGQKWFRDLDIYS